MSKQCLITQAGILNSLGPKITHWENYDSTLAA